MMSRFIRSGAAVALVAGILAAAGVNANAKNRLECDRDYKPQVGQSGKDVVWVPTPDEMVQHMLRMAKVTPQDVVYDLGAGDGKIAIEAGKLGATSVGIEYNPKMAKLAQCYVRAANLAGKTRIIQGDVFKEDFSKASVVTMYLLPELNLRLRPTILNMRPGTRITSHQFKMGDWEPDETAVGGSHTAYLWIVPPKIEGTWTVREQGGGNAQYTINLSQSYQKISGDVAAGTAKQPLFDAILRGEHIRFAFNDEKGVTRTLIGTVHGNELTSTLTGADGVETKVTGMRD
jgi:SAM-dependent methyltransferase